MRLNFKLLVIDDHPESVESAISILDDYLDSVGFELQRRFAKDLTDLGLKKIARKEGSDYDLVIIDYNLGQESNNGATAAGRFRRELPYTDIIFYSSDPSADLLKKLADESVAGVFVASRDGDLPESLVGIAATIIRKAVDLSHMRGIAMAEVAEMDVIMEEALERVFASADKKFAAKGTETLAKLIEQARQNVSRLEPIVDNGRILEAVLDSRLFSSAHKYMAVRRVAKCLSNKPDQALEVLSTYEADVITNRNTLAHAKEEIDADGNTTIRSIKRGMQPIAIDEQWMAEFRAKLRRQRLALTEVCDALHAHLDGLSASDT